MLEIAGGDINYLADRGAGGTLNDEIWPIVQAYNEKHNRSIRLINPEWLASTHSPEPFEEPGIDQNWDWDGSTFNDYNKTWSRHQISWNYALNGAHRILNFISCGGEFYLANFSNMANTFGQNLIEASKDDAWLSCMGEVFAMFHRQFVPCHAAPAETGDETVFALFTKDDRDRQKLYVVNHSSKEKTFLLPEGFSRALDGLSAPSRSVYVTQTGKPVRKTLPEVKSGKVTLPPLFVGCFA